MCMMMLRNIYDYFIYFSYIAKFNVSQMEETAKQVGPVLYGFVPSISMSSFRSIKGEILFGQTHLGELA